MKQQICLCLKRKVHFSSQFQPISIQTARLQQKRYCEYSNELILNLALSGDQDAREERLIREIMSVENKDWEEVQAIYNEMLTENRKNLFLYKLPYKLGIIGSISAGWLAFPLIFHEKSVRWFNEKYVTSDVPEPKDIETFFEVGGWAWNWMEPMLGQLSFFLLCMQFARNQMQNLQLKPFTTWMRSKRANRLANKYQQYDRNIVESWSFGDSFSKKENRNTNI